MYKWQTALDLTIMLSIAVIMLVFAVIAKNGLKADLRYKMLVERVEQDKKELQVFLNEHPEFREDK